MFPESDRRPNARHSDDIVQLPLSGGATLIEVERWKELISRPREDAPLLDAQQVYGLSKYIFGEIVPGMRELSNDRDPEALGLPYLVCALESRREGRGDVIGLWVNDSEEHGPMLRVDRITDARVITNPRSIQRIERMLELRAEADREGRGFDPHYSGGDQELGFAEEEDPRYVAYKGARFLFDRSDCALESTIVHPNSRSEMPEMIVSLPETATVRCRFNFDDLPAAEDFDAGQLLPGRILNLIIDYRQCNMEDREGVGFTIHRKRNECLLVNYLDGVSILAAPATDTPDLRIDGKDYSVIRRRLVRPMTAVDLELFSDRVAECANWLQQATDQWEQWENEPDSFD